MFRVKLSGFKVNAEREGKGEGEGRGGEEGRREGELLGFYAAASRLTRPSVRPSAPLSNAALSLAANEDVYLARPEKKSASRCSFLHSCQLERG